ncbi:MAG: chromate resistance protein [Candidatus Roizmanbacteria bacterium]|nr:MAG: chromate resistance protein [Candidatus Roizmanbacteria bacterium]
MKTLVTHFHPDLDSLTSCWLIKRFYPGWEDAEIVFVDAGKTLNDNEPDTDPNILHIDTGLGQFDHHQTNEYTSATQRVYFFLLKNKYLSEDLNEQLERIVNHVNDVDHFAEVYYPNPTSDIYDFNLSQIIEGLNATLKSAHKVMDHGFITLDAILQLFKNKIAAEKAIKEGYVFESKWGKTLAMETKNEESMKLALKTYYKVVIRKDPEKGNLRIKTLPQKELDLTPLYQILKKQDPKATWYLHLSKNMLLNGSSKRPSSVPTSLSLKKVIEIIKEI